MHNTKKGTILVVDDETSIRSLLTEHFNKSGYEVLNAENGENALQVLEEVKVDIIISDIVMPGMDGVELVKRVRTEYPMIRIIMMTGFVKIENLLVCVQNQVDTVIFKPFKNLEEFSRAVDQSLKHLQHWQSKLQEYESFFGNGVNINDE